jgi:hypothetical protein
VQQTSTLSTLRATSVYVMHCVTAVVVSTVDTNPHRVATCTVDIKIKIIDNYSIQLLLLLLLLLLWTDNCYVQYAALVTVTAADAATARVLYAMSAKNCEICSRSVCPFKQSTVVM